MQLTDRDVEIMRFINDFGFCEMPQIEVRFGIKPQRSYRVLGRLVKAGLVKHQPAFHRRYGVYYLSADGARYTDLPRLDKIRLAQYEHHIAIIKVALKLRSLYPEAYWMSERQLKFDKFVNGVGRRGHMADGMLLFPDDKQVAIEVELSIKGKNRLKKILNEYRATFSINEIWYYCSANVIPSMTAVSVKMPFIKIFNLENFLK
jgi:hypothetical protein